MGLSSILSVANSGLRVTQSGLEVVARNVANADTPGYTRKTVGQENLFAGDRSLGVRELNVSREIDQFLQTQLRLETSTFSSLSIQNQFLTRVDQLFGEPGAANSLDTIVNEFSQSLQELTGSPESYTNRELVVSNAQALTQQLHSLSNEVQSLRQSAEDGIATAVTELNDALGQLQKINEQLLGEVTGSPPADLLDERDKFIGLIAEYIDIRVTEDSTGQVTILAQDGNTLLDGLPATLEFDQRGDISAHSLYSNDPAERGVGTITLTSVEGYSIDLIRNGSINSGRIGGLIDLRDDILVETQAQLDELAHGLALALSSYDVESTPATVGLQTGFDIDTTNLQPGNTLSFTYTDTAGPTTHNVTIVRVDDASQLPLANTDTPNPNDTVIGIDFSAGPAAAAAALDTALGAGISVSVAAGNTLRFLDDGAAGTTDVNALSSTVTATSFQDEGLQIPFFVDGGLGPNGVYSNSLDFGGQKLGFASRIEVSAALQNDNELLVRHSTSPATAIGDPDRPLDILKRLTEDSFTFSPQSGIGNSNNPLEGSVTSFAQRVVSFQSGQAEQNSRELASQEVVTYALQDRFNNATGVDVNQELSNLIDLQNAFSANARVIQTVSDLMQILLQI